LLKVRCHAHACRGHERNAEKKPRHAHDKRGHGTFGSEYFIDECWGRKSIFRPRLLRKVQFINALTKRGKPIKLAGKEGLFMNTDQEHLRLLSLFHYILAGLTAVMACFPVIHLIIGIAFLTNPDVFNNGPGNQPPPPKEMMTMIGLMFTIIPALLIILGWIFSFCLFLAGKNLKRRTRYSFCFAIAIVSCLCAPLGTVLGVFTLIVLSRPSVKTLFDRQPPFEQNASSPFMH
jgi:hypothetical protein